MHWGEIIIKKIYIIGAGVSGLSSAVYAIKNNFNFEIFESSKFAGGRCRSFYDKKMGIEIDNGNHLVFSANENFLDFCKDIESKRTLKVFPPCFGFFDLKEKKKMGSEPWK